jgi:hypothetical protein
LFIYCNKYRYSKLVFLTLQTLNFVVYCVLNRPGFKSWPCRLANMTEVFHNFPHFPQAKADEVPQIRAWLLSFKFNSLFTHHCHWTLHNLLYSCPENIGWPNYQWQQIMLGRLCQTVNIYNTDRLGDLVHNCYPFPFYDTEIAWKTRTWLMAS